MLSIVFWLLVIKYIKGICCWHVLCFLFLFFFPPLLARCRYETSCTAEQIPSCLWPGGEERPMLRWHPCFKGHMGQCLLCSQPEVCRPHYWGQWWRSFPRSPSSQGEVVLDKVMSMVLQPRYTSVSQMHTYMLVHVADLKKMRCEQLLAVLVCHFRPNNFALLCKRQKS